MRPVNLRAGTATAIGSLPHRQVDAAVALALAAAPDLPAAPSLPLLDRREGMIAQAAVGLRGVEVDAAGELALVGPLDPRRPFRSPSVGAADPLGDGPGFVGLRAFLEANRRRSGPVKLQHTGPVTLALALVSVGAPASTAFAAAGAATRERTTAILELARRMCPLAPPVLFLDEPGLVALSAPDAPIGADDALDLVSGALAAVEGLAVTGLHCCGDTDWRLALAAGPQILSIPANADVVAHAGALGAHLDRGGWVAWGAVPTARPVGDSPRRLWRSLSELWCQLVQRGCDALRLREQSLVSPECGLAGHDPIQAERVLGLSAELGERVRRQSFGVRLSIGA